ncbi:PD-(D/E)XK nuclease family protein [Phytoactinopolyspora halophila]|nr:PD-(D/E)XK nuclease family protein [Phytoactinopolyspora halophila]
MRIYDAAHRLLAPAVFDEVDLIQATTDRIRTHGISGSFVVFLPQPRRACDAELLRVIAMYANTRVILGFTGEAYADEAAHRLCRDLGADMEVTWQPPVADALLNASDPDDEVRAVVRRVKEALVEHPGHRIAVWYGTASPYARLLDEHFDQAGVQIFGNTARSLAETTPGRAFRRLLALPAQSFRRDDVLALLADTSISYDGIRAPRTAWERISRTAGVVSGDDWNRVREFARRRRRWLADYPDTDEATARRTQQAAEHAEKLHEFVTFLQHCHAQIESASSWQELGEGVEQLWSLVERDWRPATATLARQEDVRGHRRISEFIVRVGELDGTAGAPDPLLLRQLVEIELDHELGGHGTVGRGVHVGPISHGPGADVDLVFVVGAAEGFIPARIHEDPLVPDRARVATNGALGTRRERLSTQHHFILASLAAAPRGGRTLTFPRGDLRQGGTKSPSRWTLPTIRALDGRADLVITHWERARGLTEIPSYTGAVERDLQPATAQEWRQRTAVTDPGCDDSIVTRALTVHQARLSSEFTPFDGNLAGMTNLPDPTLAPVSVTALESWVHCPHGYFVRHILGVLPIEDPEDAVRISARDRGNVLHKILERLVTSALEDGWAPGHGQSWPRYTHRMIDQIADEEFAVAKAEGLTGYPILWDADREALRADLHAWVSHDDRRRAELGNLAPYAAEWPFEDVDISLADGRALRVRGKIDRIDRGLDGRLVVTDYKSGRLGRSYTRLTGDPCDRGQRLQLPIYAIAVGTAYGETRPVRSEYWFTSRRAGFARVGYDVDDAVLGRVTQALRTIMNGISGGIFPQRPNDDGNVLFECNACEIHGPEDRQIAVAWQAKTNTPELAELQELLNFGGLS